MTHFHLFVYGTLRSAKRGPELLHDCEWIGTGTVHGTLYDIDGEYPALMLYGNAVVDGEIWRCPSPALLRLDEYEGVRDGLFRRVARQVSNDATGGETACWLYVAGPALSRRLTPERRLSAAP